MNGAHLPVDNHLAAHPREVPAYVPDHSHPTGFTPVETRSTTEPCNSVHPANSLKAGTKCVRKRPGNLRGDKSLSSFETGDLDAVAGSGAPSRGHCEKLSMDVGGESPWPMGLMFAWSILPIFTLGKDVDQDGPLVLPSYGVASYYGTRSPLTVEIQPY